MSGAWVGACVGACVGQGRQKGQAPLKRQVAKGLGPLTDAVPVRLGGLHEHEVGVAAARGLVVLHAGSQVLLPHTRIRVPAGMVEGWLQRGHWLADVGAGAGQSHAAKQQAAC